MIKIEIATRILRGIIAVLNVICELMDKVRGGEIDG